MQDPTPQPAQPAQPPQIPGPAIAPAPPGGPTPIAVEIGGTNREIYEGARAARNELRNVLERLQEEREEISSQLQDPMTSGANRTGLEKRITEIDSRISTLHGEIAQADAAVARSAALPGATTEPPRPPREGPPEEVFVLGGIFGVIVLLPLSIAYARRIWRRGATVVTNLPKELGERFTRLEQAVDAIAVEVERLGEGQRYMTRIFTEQPQRQAIPAASEGTSPDQEGLRRR